MAVAQPQAKRIDADLIADPFKQGIQSAVSALTEQGQAIPKLVGFLANTDPAAKKYAVWTEKAFKRDGLDFELRLVDELALEDALEAANEDPGVHGIMIYYPVFGQRPCFHGGSQDDYLRDLVSPYKDIEGLCHFYRRSLYRNRRFVDSAGTQKCILPCTPLAIVKVLEHLEAYDTARPVGDRLQGKTVTIVNRSEVVGRPLAAMLANDGARVYSVDIDSVFEYRRGKLSVVPEGALSEGAEVVEGQLLQERLVRASDVVVLGVPSNSYKLDVSWVKEHAIVINVATQKNVDEEALLQTCPGVQYVPQVGKVTVAMLERNLLRLHQNFANNECLNRDADLATLELTAGQR